MFKYLADSEFVYGCNFGESFAEVCSRPGDSVMEDCDKYHGEKRKILELIDQILTFQK